MAKFGQGKATSSVDLLERTKCAVVRQASVQLPVLPC